MESDGSIEPDSLKYLFLNNTGDLFNGYVDTKVVLQVK